ncbi:uncharacterized protein LOC135113520 [Scylla paramamosain]|uniref:uncharacterized protein LOC135113520 n=1 Tax=Scylla paramamosain TaxID=85552 RepID=UPI003083D769
MDALETLGEKENAKKKATKKNKRRLENLEDCTSYEKTVTEGCAELKHSAKRSKGRDENHTNKADREQEVSKHDKNKVDGVEGFTEHKNQKDCIDIKDKKTMSMEYFYPVMGRTKKRERQDKDGDEKQEKKRKRQDIEETGNQDKKRKRVVKEDNKRQGKKRKRQIKEDDEKRDMKKKRQDTEETENQDKKRKRQDTEDDEKQDKKRKRQVNEKQDEEEEADQGGRREAGEEEEEAGRGARREAGKE